MSSQNPELAPETLVAIEDPNVRICILDGFDSYGNYIDQKHVEVLLKKCYFCPYENRLRELVFEHTFSAHSKRPVLEVVSCPRCSSFRATSSHLIDFHLSKSHGEIMAMDAPPDMNIICHICDFKTVDQLQLGNHLVEKHLARCEICNFSTISQELFAQHMKNDHNAEGLIVDKVQTQIEEQVYSDHDQSSGSLKILCKRSNEGPLEYRIMAKRPRRELEKSDAKIGPEDKGCHSPRKEVSDSNERVSMRCSVCSEVSNNIRMSCKACKHFFSRANRNNKKSTFVCHKDGDCDISFENKKKCQKCRYEKCLRVGMVWAFELNAEQKLACFEKQKDPVAVGSAEIYEPDTETVIYGPKEMQSKAKKTRKNHKLFTEPANPGLFEMDTSTEQLNYSLPSGLFKRSKKASSKMKSRHSLPQPLRAAVEEKPLKTKSSRRVKPSVDLTAKKKARSIIKESQLKSFVGPSTFPLVKEDQGNSGKSDSRVDAQSTLSYFSSNMRITRRRSRSISAADQNFNEATTLTNDAHLNGIKNGLGEKKRTEDNQARGTDQIVGWPHGGATLNESNQGIVKPDEKSQHRELSDEKILEHEKPCKMSQDREKPNENNQDLEIPSLVSHNQEKSDESLVAFEQLEVQKAESPKPAREDVPTFSPMKPSRKAENEKKQDLYLPRDILSKLQGKLCLECNYFGPKRFDTIRHIRNLHLRTKFFKCNHCSFSNEYLKCLSDHYHEFHVETGNNMPYESGPEPERPNLKENQPKVEARNVNRWEKANPREDRQLNELLLKTLNNGNGMRPIIKKFFKCPSCSFKSEIDTEFQKHMNLAHLAYTSNQENVEPNPSNLASHSTSSTTKPNNADLLFQELVLQNACILCRYQNEDQAVLERHLQLGHVNLKSMTCLRCNWVIPNCVDLVQHLKEKHMKPTLPQNATNEKESAELKSQSDQSICPFSLKCARCEFDTISDEKLVQHIKERHSTPE